MLQFNLLQNRPNVRPTNPLRPTAPVMTPSDALAIAPAAMSIASFSTQVMQVLIPPLFLTSVTDVERWESTPCLMTAGTAYAVSCSASLAAHIAQAGGLGVYLDQTRFAETCRSLERFRLTAQDWLDTARVMAVGASFCQVLFQLGAAAVHWDGREALGQAQNLTLSLLFCLPILSYYVRSLSPFF